MYFVALATCLAQGLFIGTLVKSLYEYKWVGAFSSMVAMCTTICAIAIGYSATYGSNFKELVSLAAMLTLFATGAVATAALGWTIMHYCIYGSRRIERSYSTSRADAVSESSETNSTLINYSE